VLLAAAVISTLNFAFEISTDGVPRAATSTNKRAAYRMRAAKAAGAHTAEIVSSLGIRAEVPYRRSDTSFFGTIRSVPMEDPRYDTRSEHRSERGSPEVGTVLDTQRGPAHLPLCLLC
jgi:hypothetical protein